MKKWIDENLEFVVPAAYYVVVFLVGLLLSSLFQMALLVITGTLLVVYVFVLWFTARVVKAVMLLVALVAIALLSYFTDLVDSIGSFLNLAIAIALVYIYHCYLREAEWMVNLQKRTRCFVHEKLRSAPY